MHSGLDGMCEIDCVCACVAVKGCTRVCRHAIVFNVIKHVRLIRLCAILFVVGAHLPVSHHLVYDTSAYFVGSMGHRGRGFIPRSYEVSLSTRFFPIRLS